MKQAEMVVTMTKTDFIEMMSQMVEEKLTETLQKFAKAREKPLPTDIKGKSRIAKYLGADPHLITDLVKNNTLGNALWKGSGVNSIIHFDRMIGEKRYLYFIRQPEEVQQAWLSLSSDETEVEWQGIGL